MEKNNISIIRGDHGSLRLTEHTSFPGRYSQGKHAIQASKIRNLLLIIRKQDH
jgi:hypothetical protein